MRTMRLVWEFGQLLFFNLSWKIRARMLKCGEMKPWMYRCSNKLFNKPIIDTIRFLWMLNWVLCLTPTIRKQNMRLYLNTNLEWIKGKRKPFFYPFNTKFFLKKGEGGTSFKWNFKPLSKTKPCISHSTCNLQQNRVTGSSLDVVVLWLNKCAM